MSLLNLTTNTKLKGKSGRDPADIRKIEELKKELSDMHESLAKRYPDSVATLIQASKLSDSVQVETKRREKELQDAKEELVKSKEEFERRLRSLRQEHEKIKFQYEERIKNLQNTTATKSNHPSSLKLTTVTTVTGTDAGQMNSNGNYKNLTVANSKIRELEKEIERIRLFYTKKVEETQRKADNQMRALKRGDNTIDSEENKIQHGTDDYRHDHQSPPPPTPLPPKIIQEYELKVSMLEKELYDTSELLGRVQSQLKKYEMNVNIPSSASSNQVALDGNSLSHLPNPPPPPIHENNIISVSPANIPSAPQRIETPFFLNQKDPESENRINTIISLNTKVAELGSELSHLQSDYNQLKSKLNETTNEKTILQTTVNNLTSDLQSKILEISTLNNNNTMNPQSIKIQALEFQLKRLEDKISSREAELNSLLEENRAAARIERSRIQSIHAQVCMELECIFLYNILIRNLTCSPQSYEFPLI